jgi:glutathione synthase
MPLKLGVIMDPIEKIRVGHDSTFAMLLAAQKRKWQIFYMKQQDLFLQDDAVLARMRELQVFDHPRPNPPPKRGRGLHFKFSKEKVLQLHKLDVILMRKDPPVDMEYIYTTQLLDLAEKRGVLVVNKPQSLRDFNEKLFISYFPECISPTLVTHHAQSVRDFLQEHKDVICKPLNSMGGQNIFRLRAKDPNVNVVIETLTQNGTRAMLVQRFIPEITKGDKRILLINGEPVPYALARLAQPGETRANMAAGGRGVGVKLTKRDRFICEQVGPTLREKGILFAGIDVIGDYLTEINITSPTCIRELDAAFSLNISAQLLDCIQEIKQNK